MDSKDERDQRLCRAILTELNMAQISPMGGERARTVVESVNDAMLSAWGEERTFESDDHAILLIRKLVNRGYVTEERKLHQRGETFGLRHLTLLSITAKGTDLLEQRIAPDSLVWDERVED